MEDWDEKTLGLFYLSSKPKSLRSLLPLDTFWAIVNLDGVGVSIPVVVLNQVLIYTLCQFLCVPLETMYFTTSVFHVYFYLSHTNKTHIEYFSVIKSL